MPSMSSLEQDGYAVVSDVLTSAECAALADLLGTPPSAGRRGLLSIPEIRCLAASEKLLALLRSHLPSEPFAVRGIYFDKSPDTNWLVSWHQDLTICVQERKDVAGFGPWSVKDSVPHVQPPVSLLENMLTIRLHLDDTDETNGALRVIAGSHRSGRLNSQQIQQITERSHENMCVASQGAALLMRPLILHASSRSTSTKHRRVIHLEYACTPLDAGLEWQKA